MIGQKVLQFQITEKLGEGGMGVVYKAEDEKLHRTVALKFLSTQVTERPGEQERLVNEARAAAGLQHPNICTIYEINEYKGQTFIVMSYIDGVTLRDRILSSTISVDDALKIALQIGQGLEQAHGKGFIHRDIKSANIMVDDVGRAYIMDFGLARRRDQAKPEDVLSSGGTSAYMSPEQARGEGVDERTDIWSLGVVVYEMLAGQLPFRGDYEQAVRYSIVNEEPKPLSQLRPGVPEEVAAFIEKCMQKNPADRYQSVSELVNELKLVIDNRRRGRRKGRAKRAQRRAISIPIAGLVLIVAAFVVYDLFVSHPAESDVRVPIAVIDFNNETDEPALDGLSGMLITALEQSRKLSVMTRTRMFDELKVMGRDNVTRIDESLGQELCRQAGVGALVIPTIHRFGDRYTIDLKVLDTRRNEYIFTTKEEGQGQESIPGMIDEIAKNLRIDLREETEAVEENTEDVAKLTTVSLEAYQHYFEGEQLLNGLDFKGAAKEFVEALAIDSTFALADYRLAYTQWWSRHELEAAESHVKRAMASIDRIPEKERYLVRALNASLEDGFQAGMPYLRDMQKLYPDDKEMLFGIGDIAFHLDNYDTAQVYFERVLELDPKFERALQHLTWTYLRTDQTDKGYQMARKWADVTESAESYQYLGNASFMLGNGEEAIAHFQKARELSPSRAWGTIALAQMYLKLDKPDKSAAELRSILQGDYETKEKYMATGALVGGVLPYLGRYKEAVALVDVALDSLRADPDTTMLLKAILGKAGIIYWGWRDTERMWELVRSTYSYPDEVKNTDYWMELASYHFFAGDADEGRRILDRQKDIKDYILPLFRSLEYAGRGDCATAQTVLDTAGVLTEQYKTGVRFYTALCYIDQEDYKDAIDQLLIVVDRKNLTLENAAVVPMAHYRLAKSYEALGKVALAIEQYERLLDMWKGADKDHYRLVDARARLEALRAAGSM
jgi:tetratricopeptide (TPR) repeat protein/tRNA A-37 threonylcarbamoyl transferase component Bud32